jgi:diaminopimelate epimerase
VTLASLADLYALDLASAAPVVTPSLPDGQNVEFVVVVADHHLKMRVHERGVGETRSCGTGICAAVAAVSGELSAGHPTDSRPWRVDVPGGSCVVSRQSDGQLTLTGPAVLVGEINLNPDWIAAIQTSGQ